MTKRAHAAIGFFLVWILCSCADSHSVSPVRTLNAEKLPRSVRLLVTTPPDGFYGEQVYAGSGKTTSLMLRNSLMGFSSQVDVLESDHLESSLDYARDGGYAYLFRPIIRHWEDRATEWSGIPDRVEVQVDVYRVSSREVLQSALIRGKSGLATWGGDHPQGLLPEPFDRFAATLFQ